MSEPSAAGTVNMVTVLRRQVEPTLEMLRLALQQCPDEMWAEHGPGPAVWQHGYHTLLSLAIWLRWPTPKIAFPPFHHEGAGEPEPGAEPVYNRELLETYRHEVQAQVADYFDHLTPENVLVEIVLRGKPFARADLVLGQIRHVQHHVGCMYAQVRRKTGAILDWKGYGEE